MTLDGSSLAEAIDPLEYLGLMALQWVVWFDHLSWNFAGAMEFQSHSLRTSLRACIITA